MTCQPEAGSLQDYLMGSAKIIQDIPLFIQNHPRLFSNMVIAEHGELEAGVLACLGFAPEPEIPEVLLYYMRGEFDILSQ